VGSLRYDPGDPHTMILNCIGRTDSRRKKESASTARTGVHYIFVGKECYNLNIKAEL